MIQADKVVASARPVCLSGEIKIKFKIILLNTAIIPAFTGAIIFFFAYKAVANILISIKGAMPMAKAERIS